MNPRGPRPAGIPREARTMTFDPHERMAISDDTLLLLNRATLVAHAVRGAVHELNNVLQMIGGSAEMLASAGVPPAATSRIDAILRQTARGHGVLQALGDFGRGQPAAAHMADVSAAVDRALQLRRYEHTRSGIAVTRETRGSGPQRVRIDAQELVQAILNLILNAEQAVAGVKGPAIDIAVVPGAEAVEIVVADNGPGVDSGADVAAPFVTTRGRAAAGLGLTATGLIAARWAGALESVDVADGACWRLRLPVAAAGS
jgi:two-component system C4-dicarboxylate transport sensor histidine kinase DctB